MRRLLRALKRPIWAAALIGVGLLGIGRGEARADIIATLFSITPEGANFRWTYLLEVEQGQTVLPGSFFTIYDFTGFAGGAINPAGWTFSSALTGITPAAANVPIGVSPAGTTDDPSIPNLTFTRNAGQPPIVGVGAGTFLGFFSALSDSNNARSFPDRFAAEAGDTNFPVSVITNVDNVATPAAVVIPEPATLVALGMAVPFGLPLVRRWRKGRTAV